MFRDWFRKNRAWVAGNLIWGGIFFFCGFVFALFARVLPCSFAEAAWQEAGGRQLVLAGVEIMLYLAALASAAAGIYGQALWIAAFLKEIMGKRRGNRETE